MELRIKVGKTRSVSARALCRGIAQHLDELETEGSTLTILRYGRPVALLVPLETNVRRAPRRVAIEQIEQEEPLVMPELGDVERRVLLEMAACAPDPYDPDEWRGSIGAFGGAFVRLEMKGLVDREGGRWLTADGERVAAALAGATPPAG